MSLLLMLAALSSAASAAGQSRPLNLGDLIRFRGGATLIGVESKEGPDLFEQIRGAALDAAGRVFVLDAGDHSIRAFSSDGAFLGRAGRAGRGPGDLAYPHSIVHDGDSTLFVIDELNGINEVRTGATGLRFVRSFGSSLFPRAACLLDRQLFVAGYSSGRILHAVSNLGKVLRSFGDGFNRDTIELLRVRANREPVLIACEDRHDRIIIAQTGGSGLRAYSARGELLWATELEGYKGTRFQADASGLSVFWGTDMTESLVFLNDSLVLVQVQRIRRIPAGAGRSRRTAFERTTLTSTVIDAASGQVLGRSDALPLVKSVRDDLLVLLRHDPFPVVTLRSFTVAR